MGPQVIGLRNVGKNLSHLRKRDGSAVPGAVLGHHTVLNYIDSSGTHRTLQGVPEHGFNHNIDKLGAFVREEMFSDGANNLDSPFGRLRAEREGQDFDVSLSRPYTMVAEGDDLSSRWALMQDFADEVNSTGYEYRPKSQNSNSFAGGALHRAGFLGPGTEFPERFNNQLVFDPISGETKPFYIPGFEKPLANPIDGATPMPFPLDPPAAPDRYDSFSDRFGKWGSAPVGDFGNPRSPVLRALQDYRRSEAPGGPASSTWAQGASPVTPLPQRNFPNEESALGNRLENAGGPGPDAYPQLRRISSAFPDVIPSIPNQAAAPERAPPLGIFSGKPLSQTLLPPSTATTRCSRGSFSGSAS